MYKHNFKNNKSCQLSKFSYITKYLQVVPDIPHSCDLHIPLPHTILKIVNHQGRSFNFRMIFMDDFWNENTSLQLCRSESGLNSLLAALNPVLVGPTLLCLSLVLGPTDRKVSDTSSRGIPGLDQLF